MADSEKILSQHEVDALLSAIDSGSAEMGADAAALEYDFKRPVRLSRDQVRAFEILQESVARGLQPALSGLLRAPVEVRLAGVHQGSLREFVSSLPSPTAVAVVRAEPSGETGILELHPLIAFPFVERLLGAPRPGPSSETRALTALEWGVLDTAVLRILERTAETWGQGTRFEVVRREGDPGALSLAGPNDAAVSVAFEVMMGEQRGGLELAFPVRTVERVVGRAHADPRREGGAGELSEQIFPARVRLTAHLPEFEARLGDLRRLGPGDLLVTGNASGDPVVVSVGGRSKFAGRPGRLKEHKAVQVIGPGEALGGRSGPAERRSGTPGAALPSGGILDHLLALALPGSVLLAEKTVPVREAAGLRVGDVLRFDRPADRPLELQVGRRRVGRGVVVRVGDRFGLRITEVEGGARRGPDLG